MVNPKKDKKSIAIAFSLFIFLVIFAFGQLVSFNVNNLGIGINLNLLDVAAGFCLLASAIYKVYIPRIYKIIISYISVAAFSLMLSAVWLPIGEVTVGFFYLIRLSLYSFLFVTAYNFVSRNLDYKLLLLNSLLASAFFIGVFGWIQYLWMPDLRSLILLGWDDHLYRLVGTFLDPAFMGILLGLGFVVSLYKFLENKSYLLFFLILFFILTLLFTYSRDSYLAAAAGAFYFFRKKFLVYVAVVMLIGLSAVILLPKKATEASKFARIYSVNAKFQNYKETLSIFSAMPVFGTGYNTICSYRVRMFNDSFASHSCYGSDSSLLLILTTTGVVGLSVFVYLLLEIGKDINKSKFKDVFYASSVVVFAHSLFVNSLFYPWVLGWMMILLAISVDEEAKGEM